MKTTCWELSAERLVAAGYRCPIAGNEIILRELTAHGGTHYAGPSAP
jgi:hypothetical protein